MGAVFNQKTDYLLYGNHTTATYKNNKPVPPVNGAAQARAPVDNGNKF